MAATLTPRRGHLSLVTDSDRPELDRDPTDQGVRVPQERGRALTPTDHQREQVIADVARRQGWAGTPEEQALRRRARRVDCPRVSCRAPATRGCRHKVRGQWRPIDGMHAERIELVSDDDAVTDGDPPTDPHGGITRDR